MRHISAFMTAKPDQLRPLPSPWNERLYKKALHYWNRNGRFNESLYHQILAAKGRRQVSVMRPEPPMIFVKRIKPFFYLAIVFLVSCRKPVLLTAPCYTSYVVCGQSTTEYPCYWNTVIDLYKIQVCGSDTTILNCYNTVKITPKPCYFIQK